MLEKPLKDKRKAKNILWALKSVVLNKINYIKIILYYFHFLWPLISGFRLSCFYIKEYKTWLCKRELNWVKNCRAIMKQEDKDLNITHIRAFRSAE